MNILPSSDRNALDQFATVVRGNEVSVKWRYFGNSTHFLILVNEAFTEKSVEEYLEKLQEKNAIDAELLGKDKVMFAEDTESIDSAFLISVQQYHRDMDTGGWKYMYRQGPKTKKIPLRVAVFACIVTEKNEIEVFLPETDEHISFFPITIRYSQNVKGLGKKHSELWIEGVQGFKDGCMGYKIPEIGIDIPLTNAALGRELEIKLPGKDELEIYVAKEYRKYYKLEEIKRK